MIEREFSGKRSYHLNMGWQDQLLSWMLGSSGGSLRRRQGAGAENGSLIRIPFPASLRAAPAITFV
jgi:hypothetical protein